MNEEQNTQNLPPVLAVDIGGTQLRAGVLQGTKLHSRVVQATGVNPTPDNVLPRVFDLIDKALAEAHVRLDSLAGIGVATPGPLDYRTGIVYNPPNLPGWIGVPLRDLFQQHYSLPIHVENDANAAGLGEYMFGAGQGSKDMIYLTVSTGIGGGIILNGKILEGVNGTAAEIGHMSIDWHGPRCNCGSYGCLEYLASGTAIARMANEAIEAGQGAELLAFASTMLEHPANVPDRSALPQPQDLNTKPLSAPDELDTPAEPLRVNARTVARAAEANIPLAREIITRAGEALGAGLVNLIHIFNPELIVLGGGVTQMGPMLMEPVLRIVQERAMEIPRQSVRIELARLGIHTGLIGAGALVYYYKDM
ncbi:MAG TPA: ROK family protein [Ktedonobacteraceae bacterium]|jgi:glucokinase|nr:ROK family protein [Ktedonobacteraceae bacterium]